MDNASVEVGLECHGDGVDVCGGRDRKLGARVDSGSFVAPELHRGERDRQAACRQ